ncbi:MAG: MFS transporter [Chthoniobacter sp.]
MSEPKANTAPVSPASPWSLLSDGPFARYMAGESISMLGTWMQMMAQGWVVAGLTTSAFTLGMMNFASGLPMLLLTTWGGVLADRHDKRRIPAGHPNRANRYRRLDRLAGGPRHGDRLAHHHRRDLPGGQRRF